MILITLVSNSREQIARFRLTVSDCDCINVNVIVVSCFVVGRNYKRGIILRSEPNRHRFWSGGKLGKSVLRRCRRNGLQSKLRQDLPVILKWALDRWTHLPERSRFKLPPKSRALIDRAYMKA